VDTIVENRILPSGTGYWSLEMFPIGGSFHRTIARFAIATARQHRAVWSHLVCQSPTRFA
jgi:hypothetical protein